MRATHTAGGYTVLDPSSPLPVPSLYLPCTFPVPSLYLHQVLDPSSPVFLRGDTVYVPCVFVSFHGDALDEKTPLLRSMQVWRGHGLHSISASFTDDGGHFAAGREETRAA
jgi:glutamine synthetase type III